VVEFEDYLVTELNEDTHIIPEFGGVYMYIDSNQGGTYIGKAENLRLRFKGHKNNKKAKKGSFDYELIRRPEDFEYRILIFGIIDKWTLENIEAMYIQRYNSVKLGYNIRDDKQKKKEINSNSSDSLVVKEYNILRERFLNLNAKYNQALEKIAYLKSNKR